MTKGGIVDGGALSNAIDVNLESFVKFILRYLDEDYTLSCKKSIAKHQNNVRAIRS